MTTDRSRGSRLRLFVGILPPAEVVRGLEGTVAGLRALENVDEAYRWSVPEQWHLTLAFLGDVEESALPDLGARLGRAAARAEPMRLAVEGGGAFSSARRARVLWAGVTGETVRLGNLARSVSAAARRAGIDVAAERFRAHVTLARLRTPTDVRAAVELLRAYAGPGWVAEELRLIRSRLGEGDGGRARYETLQAWRFGRTG